MVNEIKENIDNGKYDESSVEFKKDVIELINVAFEMQEYDGVAEKIYSKSYLEGSVNGQLTDVLDDVVNSTAFFKENMKIVLNTLMGKQES